MRRFFGSLAETLIVVLCLPFYAVAVPAFVTFEWLIQKRRVRPGLEITHWPAKGVREDYLVVDVSRTTEGVVGIRRRRWGVRGAASPPPYPQEVEFISVKRFWVPRPLWSRHDT